MKTYLIRPVNHLDEQWNFSAKSFDLLFVVKELSCIQKCIFYMKILLYKAANISTKRSFSSKKCDYKENGTDRNAA